MSSSPSPSDIRRWRRHLAAERAEASTYRDLAARRSGEERAILLALADAEKRHEQHWLDLLGSHALPRPKADVRTRILGFFARHFGLVFVLALVQRAEARSPYGDDADATDAMVADEKVHEEVIRGLASRGRSRMAGTFRAAVFGANDGLVSNLALVLGMAATGVSTGVVLASGVAGLLAGALSMGAGEFVSVRSQRELLAASSPNPSTREALPNLDVNANELALVYRARGMSPSDAEAHATEVLFNLECVHGEHSLTATAGSEEREQDHEEIGSAWGAALSSFCFFASGAIIPVLPYVLGLTGLAAVLTSAGLVGVALLLTGATVGVLSGASPLRRGARQLGIGWAAAAATYVLGLLFGASVS
ncbi:MAG: VIT1/CCC1 transporter family protein [Mycetocola sp.]